MNDDTGPGWHYIGVVGLRSDTEIANRCRGFVEIYRAAAGLADTGTYDLLTHTKIMRELYYFIGGHKQRRVRNGLVGDKKSAFFGNCSFFLKT